MKFKKVIALAMTAMIGLSTVACGEKEKPTQKLTMGVMGSIDAVPMVIADEKGYFAEEGLDIDLQIFKAAKDRDAALTSGALDGVLADEVAISIYQNSDIDMKITGTTNGWWILVAGKDSGIKSVSDLKGKKVGISKNTMIEYVVEDILVDNGMKAEDIEEVVIPPMPSRLEALRNGDIDAALLPAPFNDLAIADGGIEITKVVNEEAMISTTAFLQETIDNKKEEVKAFYRAYNKAIKYMNETDISEYEDVLIRVVGYSEDMRGNIVLPEFKVNYLPSEAKVQEVFDWSTANGLLTKDIKAKDVIVEVK